MKTYRYKILYINILCLAIFLASCSSEEDINPSGGQVRKLISFTPMEVSTRASQTNATLLDAFGVSCSFYSSAGTYSDNAFGSYFYNVRVDAKSGECGYYWPSADKKVSFFAYAPYGNSALTVSSASTLGRPTYTYTVPLSIGNQIDFITAEVLDHASGLIKDPVSLAFSHRCTDIKLSISNRGDQPITIHAISVYGVKYKGYYSTGWTLDDAVSTSSSHAFTLTPSNGTVAANATVDMTGTANHIIMLPQTVSSGTDFIAVDATISGQRKTQVYTLPNDLTLEEGKSYTMTISCGPQYIDVDTSSDIKDWELETKYLTIESVRGGGTLSQPGLKGSTVTGVDDWEKEDK